MKILKLILNILFIFKILSQLSEPREPIIPSDKLNSGEISVDGGVKYYELTIPSNTDKDKFNLVFRIKENSKADEGQDNFSDPDIYVSRNSKNPNSPSAAEWYSDRFGEDLLSIQKDVVEANQVFYIGISCEYKCKYEFSAQLVEQMEIFDGLQYQVSLTKGSSVTYKLRSRATEYEELSIYAFSPRMHSFKMVVSSRPTVDTKNTKEIEVAPSWISGATATISKGDKYYFKDTFYYILIETEDELAQVNLRAVYEDTETSINDMGLVFSAVKPRKSHCYKFTINDSNKNENIIMQTTLFSGTLKMSVMPWTSFKDAQAIVKNVGEDNRYTSYVYSEKFMKFKPTDFNTYLPNNVGETRDTGDVLICLYSENSFSSYVFKLYTESNTERMQKFNYLFKQVSVTGWLPAGATTKYRIVEFAPGANIKVTMTVQSGSPQLYGTICENIRRCRYNKDRITNELAANTLILSSEFLSIKTLEITDGQNLCHEKEKNQVETAESLTQNLPCAPVAIVYCEGDSECQFDLFASYENQVKVLQQRKIHYQIVPFGQVDKYEIKLDGKEENIAVILNSITGDADMEVVNEDDTVVSVSVNEVNIADVVRIRKDRIKKSGSYFVKVKGTTFASYSIYYYSYVETKKDDKDPTKTSSEQESHGMTLQNGFIIKDYFNSNNTDYKIYSYNPSILDTTTDINSKKDIRITLTGERSDFSFAVYRNLTNVKYNKDVWMKFENADWNSTYQQEIIIKKDDPNYMANGNYYIVVAMGMQYYSAYNNQGELSSQTPGYFLGATREDIPFKLQEGIPHGVFLNNDYESQEYIYIHNNMTNAMLISFNSFFGLHDVYIDFNLIVYKGDEVITSYKNFTNVDVKLLKIEANEFPSTCKDVCMVYIMVKKRTDQYSSQYLITGRSTFNEPELLVAGVVKADSTVPGVARKYYLFVSDEDYGIVDINFTGGFGKLYAYLYKNTYGTKYPTAENYGYQSDNNWAGQSIEFNNKTLEGCKNSICHLLITVDPSRLGFQDPEVRYTIKYTTNKNMRINQNSPYKSTIQAGEVQYFTTYFDSNVGNIYVTVNNIHGDVDIFMNKGVERFPAQYNSTWVSSTPYNEIIEIDKNDPNLPDKKIEGEYTLGVHGYTNSSYTLYITTHPYKIIPLNEYSSGYCRKKDGKTCYFRYNQFAYDVVYERQIWDDKSQKMIQNPNPIEFNILLNTEFEYGTGVIFAKFFPKGSGYSEKDLPSLDTADYKNVDNYQASRNFLLINLKESDSVKIDGSSEILIGVKCDESCAFDINLARMRQWDLSYLDVGRENLYYLKGDDRSEHTFALFVNQQKTINYVCNSYMGATDFTIFKNESYYFPSTAPDNYKEFSKFQLDFSYGNKTYSDSIPASENLQWKNIFIKTKPLTTSVFYIKYFYDQNWMRLNVNKHNTLSQSTNNENPLLVYFDMLENYEDVVITVQPDQGAYVSVYASIHYIEKGKEDIKSYVQPDANNKEFEVFSKTDMEETVLRIPKQVSANGKFARVLMNIVAWRSYNPSSASPGNSTLGGNTAAAVPAGLPATGTSTSTTSTSPTFAPPATITDNLKLDVLIQPTVNNEATTQISPGKAVFAKIQHESYTKDKRTFDLRKSRGDHNFLVIEISNCKGDVDVELYDTITEGGKAGKQLPIQTSVEKGGVKIITLPELKSDYYYLTLKGKSTGRKNCKAVNNSTSEEFKCDTDEIEVLIYYYTTFEKDYTTTLMQDKGVLQHSQEGDKIAIEYSQILGQKSDSIVKVNATYSIYVSENKGDFGEMESVCFLTRMSANDVVKSEMKEGKIYLSNLNKDQSYYVNVLVRNNDSSEKYAYKPIQIIYKTGGLSTFMLSVILITILVLAFFVYYFYRRFKITKKILTYEQSDIRNMGSVPKSESELKTIVRENEVKKYSSLTEEAAKV